MFQPVIGLGIEEFGGIVEQFVMEEVDPLTVPPSVHIRLAKAKPGLGCYLPKEILIVDPDIPGSASAYGYIGLTQDAYQGSFAYSVQHGNHT
jgi:hypothetical protein